MWLLTMMPMFFSTIDCRFEFLVKFPLGNSIQLSKVTHVKKKVLQETRLILDENIRVKGLSM